MKTNPTPISIDEKTDYVIVSDGRTKHVLLVENIVRLESRRVYTVFFMKNGQQFVCSRNLLAVQQELNSGFYRVHKSHIVNMSEIMTYKNGRTGVLLMSDGSVVEVSQRKKTSFLRAWEDFKNKEMQSTIQKNGGKNYQCPES